MRGVSPRGEFAVKHDKEAERLGLDPGGSLDFFTEVGVEHDQLTRIRHLPTGAFAKIDHVANFGPGYVLDFWPKDIKAGALLEGWGQVRHHLFAWLQIVKQEHEAPDLWEMARQQRA